MPELPEVETIVRQIRPKIKGRIIQELNITPKGIRMTAPIKTADFRTKIIDSKIENISRHGKFMILELSNSWHIVVHLRMSGRLTVTSKHPDHSAYNRLYLKLSGNYYLNFIDIRRFGTFHLVKDRNTYPGLQRLGADALDPGWTGAKLYASLQKHKKSIYACLLDQSIISGVGNIYANEALFKSKLHPLTPANTLTIKQTDLLLANIIDILSTALNFKGTTLLDNTYKDTDGGSGKFQKLLLIYSRKDKPCPNCGQLISRIKIGSRSVYFCGNCQIA